MAIVFLILSIALGVIAFIFNKKKAAFAALFNRQSFAIDHLLKRWVMIFATLAIINIILLIVVLCGVHLSKWIAIIDVVVVLLTSMYLSFRLTRQTG